MEKMQYKFIETHTSKYTTEQSPLNIMNIDNSLINFFQPDDIIARYNHDLIHIKKLTGKVFLIKQYLKDHGHATNNQDAAYNCNNQNLYPIGYNPIFGRIEDYGIKLHYLQIFGQNIDINSNNDTAEMNNDVGYIVPLLPHYSNHFFHMLQHEENFRNMVINNFEIIFTNSDPKSSSNKNIEQNNSNFIKQGVHNQINAIGDNKCKRAIGYALEKYLISTKDMITDQIAMVLLPYKYFIAI